MMRLGVSQSIAVEDIGVMAGKLLSTD